ncbi:hypothetical protein ACQ4PT_026893 [Festuca glaucescens]
MDPSREAELACFFLDAMHLGDPSPAREHEMLLQQHRHAAPSREQSYGALNQMMQGLQAARQFWPQPAYCPLEEMGSLSRAPAINAFVVPTQSACPYQSVAPSSSVSASASQQCQPAPSATSSSLQYQHCYIANETVPDYASSIIQRLRAIRAQAPAVRRCQTLEETRSKLLCSDMELQLATFPNSAAHVVRLLQVQEEGSERIRHSVLAGATRRVHDLMDDREGREVLAALLRACAGRYAEVRAIVQAAAVAHNPNGRHSLLRLAKHDHGETCLKELMTAAAPYTDLCAMLVDRLLREGVLEHDRGDRVLHHCFATMRYEDCVILVHDAIDKFGSLLNSKTGLGSRCLVECYAIARGDELRDLQEILLEHAHLIATGQYSNYFIQHVLQYGDDEMRQLLLERLIDNVVILSLDCYGSYVVEACFQQKGQPRRVLAAFLLLDDAQLAEVVQGKHSNYVVHKLLDATIDRFPGETMALARRIHSLLPRIRNKMYVRTVMMVVKKLIARYGRMYG